MQIDLSPDIKFNKTDEITFPEVCEMPVSWGDLNLQRVYNFKAIVNPKTGKVFSIVSKDYKLIRHEKAVQHIEDAINEYSELTNYE